MKKTEVIKRARLIKAIVSDVDGVLTDGGIIYGSGKCEIKRFHVHDGLAVALAKRAGIKVFLASARKSEALRRRSREIGVDRLWQGVSDKGSLFGILYREFGLSPREICYVGDDLTDFPLIRKAGLAVSVPSAVGEIRRAAAFVTKKDGGNGALREIVEFIIVAQGSWKDVVNAYRN